MLPLTFLWIGWTTKKTLNSRICLKQLNYSNKGYQFIKRNNLIPLPSKRVMGRWLSKLTVKPGIQEPFLGIIQKRLEGGDEREKMANLCFDEMHIRKTYEYDHRNKQVFGNHKKMMVVMVRSLFSDWKEVVYFNFDTNMTKNLIEEIIVECESRGIKIQGLVFDCGNSTILSELDFHKLNYKFVNPADPSRFVYLFPDVSHLIKLWRNHCLDKGFKFKDQDDDFHELTKAHFKQLMDSDGAELKICPKLLPSIHLEAQGSQRQRVLPAVQLFSESVGKALLFQGGNSMLVQSKAQDSTYRFHAISKPALSMRIW